jgi:beta-lactam-binding protein with PASTA domain
MSQTPTVFNGRYELHRRLARGGMADVFLAKDRLLDRPVAVKVLFPDLAADPAFVERFRREAQAAANLNHPNIVSIYDWGQQDDTYFLVMEYIDGHSLADVIRTEGRIEPDRAAEIAMEIAAALGFAHRAGVIHRDVKPGNVLLTEGGQVKVGDFGIATVMSDTNTDLTRVGTVMGTATYFSPEQAQGKVVDPRSDLYSLGIVLYEMVVGRPPFSGDSPLAVAVKHVQERPESPRALGVPIAESLDAITLKLLAKDAAHRYPTAEDLRNDLRRYRDGMHDLRRSAAAGGGAAAAPAAAAAAEAYAATRAQPVTPGAAPVGGGGGGGYPPTGGAPFGTPEPSYASYEPPPRNRGLLIAVASFLVLAALVAGVLVLSNLLADDDEPVASLIDVPNVVNKSRGDALTEIQARGFAAPRIVEDENAFVGPGIVFDQTPKGGEKVDPKQVIVLRVSLGAASSFVPNVVGLDVPEATRLLKEAGFGITAVNQASLEVPEGQTISQDPQPDQKLQAGKSVTVRVSTGGPEIDLPDFANQPAETVLKQLTDLKMQVQQLRENSDTIEINRVVRTEPGAGKVKQGSVVRVFISDGVARATVPDVSTLTADNAIKALEDRGFRVDPRFQAVPDGDPRIGKVISQTPAGNTSAVKGSTVVITVGRAQVAASTTVPVTTPTTTAAPTTTR